MDKKFDCCFCLGKDWFRYRVGAMIVSDGYALFSYGEKCGYYYTVGGGVHIGEKAEDAILREVAEETGDEFVIERPICLVQNFFDGDGALEGLCCHTLELYYLMKPKTRKEYVKTSITTGGDKEKMCWLPIDRIDEYDIRPAIAKKLLKDMPQELTVIINDDR
ncbi:MAG: NUDIX domain-containing protein [Oscillospiraceae bacterium]|nr:NUDIX domain-containing protein [Oscillospiraceae bacterium]